MPTSETQNKAAKIKRITKPKQTPLIQFTQIKGKKRGKLDHSVQWVSNEETGKIYLDMEEQKFKEISTDYLIAYHDPKTGKIEMKEALMMEVKTKMVSEVETGTTVQKWSIEHKKNMVSQFGTSQSKRKINQMLSNIIS